MSLSGNWERGRLMRHRMGRRRLLAGTVTLGAGLAGAALVGCAGEEAEEKAAPAAGTAAPAGQAAPAKATAVAAEQPQSGGTLRIAVQADVDTFDAIKAPNAKTSSYFAGYVYPRLFKFTPGVGKPAPGTLQGDLIERWEQPDPLTYILHVRKGMKWDQRPPTSGRAVNAQDVVDSWKYFKEVSFYRGDLANDVNKAAPVKTITAVDTQTAKMELAIADAAVLAVSANFLDLWQMPSEAYNGGFDPAKEWRGAGPFLLTQHRPSVGFTFKKNPDYYGAPRPYVDTIESAILPDTAQLEAQFAAKNVYHGVPEDSIVALHKQNKGTRIDLGSPTATGSNLGYDLRTGSPFLDVRVRRALNMLLDRNTIIDVMSNPKDLEGIGVKLGRYWNTPLNAGFGDFWLDPNGKDFGPAAQYLKHNVAEAKKLLAAAAFPLDKEIPLTFTTNAYGRTWPRLAEMLMSMLRDGGVKAVANGIDYATGWIPKYLRAKGEFEGLGMWPNGSRADVGQWFQTFYSSAGANNQVGKAYPELDKMIAAQQQMTDFKQRVAAVHDLQRWMVENAIAIPMIATNGVESVDLSWEGLRGRDYRTWVGGGVAAAEVVPFYWLDASLRRA
ncbi:MAG: ABC transporter substrate-binding protein [Chloroflexi bacterium]|nr:ABC transporter substrate-binding protein [Chloroflexota bacterium]